MPSVTIGLVTESPRLNAFVLTLIEEGPWRKGTLSEYGLTLAV